MRIVAHVDMDAFYASVEERLNPALRGRPVVVGADPKGGAGRGVVTAASYAARKYGIRSALPISRAWRLAEAARRRGEPEAVFVRDNRQAYREASTRIMALIADGVDAFEGASLDEAYVDLSSLGGFDEAEAHARALKARVREREELTCSVGLGPNKLVAKIASDFQKPDGLTVVRPDDVLGFLGGLRVRVVPGIGPKTEAALGERGIAAVADLRAVKPARRAEWFGQLGLEGLLLAHRLALPLVRHGVVGDPARLVVELALVAAGLGISPVPEAAQGFKRKGVVYRPLRPYAFRMEMGLAWRRDDDLALVQQFRRVARETARRTGR